MKFESLLKEFDNQLFTTVIHEEEEDNESTKGPFDNSIVHQLDEQFLASKYRESNVPPPEGYSQSNAIDIVSNDPQNMISVNELVSMFQIDGHGKGTIRTKKGPIEISGTKGLYANGKFWGAKQYIHGFGPRLNAMADKFGLKNARFPEDIVNYVNFEIIEFVDPSGKSQYFLNQDSLEGLYNKAVEYLQDQAKRAQQPQQQQAAAT